MGKELTPKLWTVFQDYSATGEGRTITAWIGYATSADTALEEFEAEFGEFWASGAEVVQGIDENETTKMLFSTELLQRVAALNGKANISVHAQFHFNRS